MVIKMNINYNTEKINEVLHNFYNATGITIDLLKSDFTKISHTKYDFNEYCKSIQSTPKGKKCCRESELTLLKKCANTKQTQMHICHAGLVDMAMPVIYNDEIIGFIVFGQPDSKLSSSDLDRTNGRERDPQALMCAFCGIRGILCCRAGLWNRVSDAPVL